MDNNRTRKLAGLPMEEDIQINEAKIDDDAAALLDWWRPNKDKKMGIEIRTKGYSGIAEVIGKVQMSVSDLDFLTIKIDSPIADVSIEGNLSVFTIELKSKNHVIITRKTDRIIAIIRM